MKPLEVRSVGVNIINGAIDLDVHQTGGADKNRTLHMTYGDWSQPSSGGASVKRSQVDADIDVSISNERNAGNGAVTFTVTAKYYNFHRTLINSQPVILDYTIHIYASQERSDERFTQTGQMQSSATYSDVSFSYDVTVPALSTVNVGMGRYWNDIENTTIDDEFNGGLTIYNPNPPDYRPWAVKYGNDWQSCNRNGGMMSVRKNGQWVECRTQDGGVGEGNPPSIREGGRWKNARKVGING